jgi:hypothetical protein
MAKREINEEQEKNEQGQEYDLIKRYRILKLAVAGTKVPLEQAEGEISESYKALTDVMDEFENVLTEYIDGNN